jgi:hypothetical protein
MNLSTLHEKQCWIQMLSIILLAKSQQIDGLTETMPNILMARACLRVHAYVEASRLVAHVCPEKQADVKGKVEQDFNSYFSSSYHNIKNKES